MTTHQIDGNQPENRGKDGETRSMLMVEGY